MEYFLGGRYRLTSELGHGGMSAVWRGVDETLNRPVAVKLITLAEVVADPVHDEMLKRFHREARAVASLNHPNIVTAYDFGFDAAANKSYLVMELIDGQSLADELARRLAAGQGPLPLERVLAIGVEVCAGLDAAHRAGIVHRDLKPANLMTVAESGRVKIVDFGIAKGTGLPQVTTAGSFVGTYAYTAPEQLESGEVDGRADVYALGCVLYELLTGRSPYDATDMLHFVKAHLHAAPIPLRRLLPAAPATLEALLLQMLAKAPADRPTVGEVAARLATIGRGKGVRVPPGSAAGSRPGTTRKRLLIGAAVIILLGGGGYLVQHLIGGHSTAAPLTPVSSSPAIIPSRTPTSAPVSTPPPSSPAVSTPPSSAAAPSITATQGAPGTSEIGTCTATSNNCTWLNFQVHDFPPGSYDWACYTNGTLNFQSPAKITVTDPEQSFEGGPTTGGCLFGPGIAEAIQIKGVMSNAVQQTP